MSSSGDGGAVSRCRTVDGVPEPPGPFSWAVRCGDLIHVSGIRVIEPETGRPSDTEERRLTLIFRYLDRILAAYGSSAENVVATRVYVTRMRELRPLINDAYLRYFGEHLPTRTIVEVSGLNQDDSIEIEAMAARAGGSEAG